MNNNIYKWMLNCSLALFFGVVMGACDVTDISPKSDFTDANFWQTRVHAEGAVVGIYDAYQALGDDFLAWGESRGDLVQPGWGFCCNEGADFGLLQMNQITDANRYTQWAPFYNVINRANVVIQKAPEIVPLDPEFSEQESDYYVGEARFLRALAYFWLARVWKDVPLLTEPTTADMDFMVKRTNQSAVLDFVEAELADVIQKQHLRQEWGGDARTNSSRATMAAARALMADVALWRNKYEVVIANTTSIIENPSYSLLDGANWYQNFNPGITNEIIFQLLYDAAQNDLNFAAYRLPREVAMVPSTYLRDLHESPNNLEYRDEVRGNGKTWTWNNAYHRKWTGNNPLNASDFENRVTPNTNTRGNSNADPNFIFYRLADIYLMRAEAYNRNGEKTKAIEDINTVRNRANLPPAIVVSTRNNETPTVLDESASPFDIEDAILEERAMELAGEAKRWFDLMRISMRDRPTLLPDYVNDGSKYSFSGSWQAWWDPTTRLEFPVSSDPDSWYLPIEMQNKITNPNLLEAPL